MDSEVYNRLNEIVPDGKIMMNGRGEFFLSNEYIFTRKGNESIKLTATEAIQFQERTRMLEELKKHKDIIKKAEEKMKEIFKKGKTFIVESLTIEEFRKKYNQDSYRIGSSVSNDIKGHVLTDGNEDYWFVEEDYLKDNYVEIDTEAIEFVKNVVKDMNTTIENSYKGLTKEEVVEIKKTKELFERVIALVERK